MKKPGSQEERIIFKGVAELDCLSRFAGLTPVVSLWSICLRLSWFSNDDDKL